MDVEDAVEILEGQISVEDTPIGAKMAVETPFDDPDYQMTRDGVEAQRLLIDRFEDDVVAIYEADGSEAVGRVLSEGAEELALVVDSVDDNDISLTTEECRAMRDEYFSE